LQQNPLYAVQFANKGIWDEAAGYNILGKVIVDASVTGSRKRGDIMQVEDLSSTEVILPPTSTGSTISSHIASHPQISSEEKRVFRFLDVVEGDYYAFQSLVDLINIQGNPLSWKHSRLLLTSWEQAIVLRLVDTAWSTAFATKI